MAIDLTNLSQTGLLQLVNATPLGTVLTRSRLRRQMDAAALRIGDGGTLRAAPKWRASVRVAKPRDHLRSRMVTELPIET